MVPWSFVYGSSADEGHDLDGIAFFGWALLIGLGAWVLCWIALAAPARALWAAAVVVALLAPAVAMNVQTFTAARRDVCEIRGGQRQGASDLHDVPWPLTVDCRP